ncbi:MAG: hypothetical protein KME17_02840 [Cyanosarcina radialis HA8281-LM2]|jgi:ABC-type multidrug transport system fused ATPase/permease subunit|nr:hypothetical protein [Cyanosarcina radialis HA8281-LM2]
MPINLETFCEYLTYEANAPIENIWKDIEEIAQLDRDAEAKQAQFTKLLNSFIVAAIIIFILLFIALVSGIQPLIVIGFILFVFCVIAAIFVCSKRQAYSRLNLPNYRYELLRKLLEMCQRDMENNSSVSVRLVFSKPTEKNKVFQTIPHPYQSGFKVDLCKDEWLKVKGEFLDRSRFVLTATELAQTKYGWKRSRSGKSKYKSKSKSRGLNISLMLDYSLRKYGAIKVLKNEAMSAIQLPQFTQIKHLKLTDKSIDLTVKMPASNNWYAEDIYKNITMMFLSLYQILNLARLLSKQKA